MNELIKQTNLEEVSEKELPDSVETVFEEIRTRGFEPFAVSGISEATKIYFGRVVNPNSDMTVVLFANIPEVRLEDVDIESLYDLVPREIKGTPVNQIDIMDFFGKRVAFQGRPDPRK